MSTPTSAATALADGSDVLVFFDAQMVGDLLADDGTRVSAAAIPTDPTLAGLLLAAQGRLEASMLKGHRYDVADLQTLTDASLQYAKQIICYLAIGQAGITRRNLAGILAEPLSWAEKRLEELENGLEIFGLVEAQAAGVEGLTTRQPGDATNGRCRLVERANRYFGTTTSCRRGC
jgi:hypothetical protein